MIFFKILKFHDIAITGKDPVILQGCVNSVASKILFPFCKHVHVNKVSDIYGYCGKLTVQQNWKYKRTVATQKTFLLFLVILIALPVKDEIWLSNLQK